jgi:hypothetical protein
VRASEVGLFGVPVGSFGKGHVVGSAERSSFDPVVAGPMSFARSSGLASNLRCDPQSRDWGYCIPPASRAGRLPTIMHNERGAPLPTIHGGEPCGRDMRAKQGAIEMGLAK